VWDSWSFGYLNAGVLGEASGRGDRDDGEAESAWLVTRIPGRGWRAGVMSAAVVTAMFGLGVWSCYAMHAAFGVPLAG
jgi:hypothetical protein